MISFRHLMVAMLPLVFFACNSNNESQASNDLYKEKNVPMPEPAGASENNYLPDSIASPPGNNDRQPKQEPGKAAPTPQVDWDKKIIKNAAVTLEVEDYKKFNELVHNTARQWGGYIAQEEQQESGYKIENTIVIKVPVDQFDQAVNSITSGDRKVITKHITSQDVTGEVIDTRSRMEAKKQVRLRYLDLLKQAKNMEEILQVQNVINDIQVQIESAAGRVNYLNHASAFSTIQLTFYQVLNPEGNVQPQQPGFGTRILNALKTGFEFVGELLIALLTLWPLWAAGGIAWWLVRKWVRRPKSEARSLKSEARS